MTGILVFVTVTSLAASAEPQDSHRSVQRRLQSQKISVHFRNATLEEVARHLQKATGIRFIISSAVWPQDSKVNLKVKDVSVTSILKLILNFRNLSASVSNGAIVIVPLRCGHPVYSLVAYDLTRSDREAEEWLMIIREKTGGDSWTTDLNVWIKRSGRAIYVRQTRVVQGEIMRLVDRRFRGSEGRQD